MSPQSLATCLTRGSDDVRRVAGAIASKVSPRKPTGRAEHRNASGHMLRCVRLLGADTAAVAATVVVNGVWPHWTRNKN